MGGRFRRLLLTLLWVGWVYLKKGQGDIRDALTELNLHIDRHGEKAHECRPVYIPLIRFLTSLDRQESLSS